MLVGIDVYEDGMVSIHDVDNDDWFCEIPNGLDLTIRDCVEIAKENEEDV